LGHADLGVEVGVPAEDHAFAPLTVLDGNLELLSHESDDGPDVSLEPEAEVMAQVG
jgi:hypothetical protein